MRYAKATTLTDIDEFLRIQSKVYYEVDANHNVLRRIDVRDYENTITLLQLDKFGPDVKYYLKNSLNFYPFQTEDRYNRLSFPTSNIRCFPIDETEFEALWAGKVSLYRNFEVIKLWQTQKSKAINCRYAKYIAPPTIAEQLTRLNVQNIIYYEIDIHNKVPRCIDIRTYDQTITLLDVSSVLCGDHRDETLVIDPFLRDLSNEPNDASFSPIEKSEFDKVWNGKSEEFDGFEILESWEADIN